MDNLIKISDLVDRFERNLDAYKSGRYNETQVRREFIDPFFKALGWDVDNTKGYAEAYKEVVHEDAIKVGRATKAPDYSFRIGGVRKFFLEAKKPSVYIKEEIHPAFQLRRYAWSAKLPVSILTDFEEFAVYDCRIKPVKTDKASAARIMYLTFSEYLRRWDELTSIFSPDAIMKGSFDKFVEAKKGKRGAAEVDEAFLEEIEHWRDSLARNLALRNPNLSQRDLNFAVQRTIDRLIFLRICEDRGIEHYETLRALQNGVRVYPRLLEMFYRADERYNSGLFHFQPEKQRPENSVDSLTPDLAIDDAVLKTIIKSLYYPDSPYEFSVLPADILGQVYERFLGKVIRLTAGHRAVVEHKPEVRKAGGVYYTPTYIVDYIVRQTVGKLLQGKKPGPPRRFGTSKPRGLYNQRGKLRILDPACGSGSFLLGAYQFLLDWHLDSYVQEAEKWAAGRNPRIYKNDRGEWRLTTDERKRILLDNIYGVDIDPQAVEVTKLSLLLKVLEGEDEQSISRQLAFFHQRVLPELSGNIKCGNSLIGPDFYDGQQLDLLNEEELYRINAFDWQAEFAEIMAAGGFDAVIGNPPYVRQEGLGNVKEYFLSAYKTFRSTADLYVVFIEKGLNLIQTNGLFGMIVSNKWLRSAYGKPLREHLTNEASIINLLNFAGLPVFPDATVRTIVLVCSKKQKKIKEFKYLAPISIEDFNTIVSGEDVENLLRNWGIDLKHESLLPSGWSLSRHNENSILEKVNRRTIALKVYLGGKVFFGIKTGLNKAFIVDSETRQKLISRDPNNEEIIKPMIFGRDVGRYSIKFNERYLIWTYVGVEIKKYPAVLEHLSLFQNQLEKRWDKGNFWWELRACDYYDLFFQPKIIYPDISTVCRFTFDGIGYLGANTTYFISSKDFYLLGLLNSKFAQFYFTEVCAGLEGGGTIYLRFFGQYIEKFPVAKINLDDPNDKARHDRMVALVQRMLDLYKQRAAAQTGETRTLFERQIAATDQQIDRLVYELYELTEEEIAIVEESTKVPAKK